MTRERRRERGGEGRIEGGIARERERKGGRGRERGGDGERGGEMGEG